MLYISAQPDDTYFVWQLEIQLKNLFDIGVDRKNIHVLIGYNADIGLNPEFGRLVKECTFAQFFIYPKDVKNSQYVSAIRPHILKKHFEEYPNLSKEVIFYHDSDVLFRERLNEVLFNNDNNWYVSDTRSYISADYIKGVNRKLFYDVCRHIGIDPSLVEQNNENAGGAQYVLKNISHQFWEQVEKDCEKIFCFFLSYNKKTTSGKYIQAWCADMWALLWNGLKYGYQVYIHNELDFCWPKDHISQWSLKKIFHNSGVFISEKQQHFCKAVYQDEVPYYVNFSHLEHNTCSQIMLNYIEKTGAEKGRVDRLDTTLILFVELQHIDQQDFIDSNIRYWLKNFNINVIVIESGDIARINRAKLFGNILYKFMGNRQRHEIISEVLNDIDSEFIVLSDADVIIPSENFEIGIQMIKDRGVKTLVKLYNEMTYIDSNAYMSFKEVLTLAQFPQGFDKKCKHYDPLNGSEVILIRLTDYKNSNMESSFRYFNNQDINLERYFRMKILGYKVLDVNSKAYRYQIVQASSPIHEIEKAKSALLLLSSRKKLDLVKRYHRFLGIKKKELLLTIYPIKTFIIQNDLDKNFPARSYQEFENRTEFSLQIVTNNGLNYLKMIMQCIRRAKMDEEPFVIVSDSLHSFTDKYSQNSLNNLIDLMYQYELDILSLGNVSGGLSSVVALEDGLVSTDFFSESSFTIIKKEAFDDILTQPMTRCFSAWKNVSMASSHVGIAYPYFSQIHELNNAQKASKDNFVDRLKLTCNPSLMEVDFPQ